MEEYYQLMEYLFRNQYPICQRRQVRIRNNDLRGILHIEDELYYLSESLSLLFGPEAKIIRVAPVDRWLRWLAGEWYQRWIGV